MNPDSDTPFTLSSKTFKYWVIDRATRRRGVVLQNTEEFWEPIAEDDPILVSQLKETIFDWEKWWVINTTNAGHIVFAEAYSPFQSDPLKGRPVVYLDQNHWSTVAQVLVDPKLVQKKSEVEPARELIRLASDAGVILPLSSANLHETSALYGDRRYEVGIAMGSLANGWTMRHPISVRKLELAQAIADNLGVKTPASIHRAVFTLEPNAIFFGMKDAALLPPFDPELFKLAQIAPSVILDVLLDPEGEPSLSIDKWVNANQAITDYLKNSGLKSNKKREYSYLSSLHDHWEQLTQAFALLDLPASRLANLDTKGWIKLFRSTRMVHIYTHIAMLRHLNGDANWKKNDLTDMLYLSCAAGYADFVAAEKNTTESIRQAQNSVGLESNIFPTIERLVEVLRSEGVKTASDVAAEADGQPLSS